MLLSIIRRMSAETSSIDRRTVQFTVALPPVMRTAVMTEADRLGVAPSHVLEDLVRQYLPAYVAESLRRSFSTEPIA